MSIRKAVEQLANRETNYRVSDYIRKLRKQYGLNVNRKQVLFVINRLKRFTKLVYSIVGEKIITNSTTI